MSTDTQQHNKVRMVSIGEEDASQRIDNFLLRILKGVPRSHIYRLLRSGQVRVNMGRIKPHYRLKKGDEVRVPPVRTAERDISNHSISEQQKRRIEEAVVYEDKTLLVLNKPPGLAVHGGSGISQGVIEQLRLARPQDKSLELVHRLDRDTSGLLMIAKRRSALRQLHEMQRNSIIHKSYLALVYGDWPHNRMKVDVPLKKNTLQGGERIVTVDQDGKTALTYFRIKEQFNDCMLVQAVLGTGRTHQIRVHAKHLGTPILGDTKYGDEQANKKYQQLGLRRLFLHAEKLSFPWGDEGEIMQLQAPLDASLQNLLSELRK